MACEARDEKYKIPQPSLLSQLKFLTASATSAVFKGLFFGFLRSIRASSSSSTGK